MQQLHPFLLQTLHKKNNNSSLFAHPTQSNRTAIIMPLFGKSQKSPAELVKALKEAVNSLERGDKKAEKAQEDVSKNLVSATRNFESYDCALRRRKNTSILTVVAHVGSFFHAREPIRSVLECIRK